MILVVVENVDKASKTSLESIDILKKVGISLRKWHTNSKELERPWTEDKVPVEDSYCLSDQGVVPLKNHCPGKDIPADFLTIDLSINKLAKCDAWWNGPNWLCRPEKNWSKSEIQGSEENLELRKKSEKAIKNQCPFRSK
ncbi:hypothetical protein NPIL_170001 [Nephila pilipes]|uniref:Uncharacterized protein n=1 Tax=Nephila pilipes TaxID=299642 RepID=A0A8X6MQP2_NEPPI|nr:hypothetical protein NPIL_170001 [Nephila pilipes]